MISLLEDVEKRHLVSFVINDKSKMRQKSSPILIELKQMFFELDIFNFFFEKSNAGVFVHLKLIWFCLITI